MQCTPRATPPGGLVMVTAYDQYCHQCDICLGCHAIAAITNKNVYGYTLRDAGSRQPEGFEVLSQETEVRDSGKPKGR